MLDDLKRLEHFLGTAGAGSVEREEVNARLSQAIFTRELGRDPEAGFLVRELATRSDVDAFVAELRATMEAFTRRHSVLGAQTEAFRRLSAATETAGKQVAGQVIAEAIAAYRLILGRDPDPSGFELFVQVRETEGLVPILRSILSSSEAVEYLAPDQPADLGSVVLAVSSAAINLVNAAGTDTILGTVASMAVKLQELQNSVEEIGRVLDRLQETSTWRFDQMAAQ